MKTKNNESEPGSEAAEPSPETSEKEADQMYREAARKLSERGAADPQKAAEIAKQTTE